MGVECIRMEERQAPPISPKESSESIYRLDTMHALGEPEQAQSQPAPL